MIKVHRVSQGYTTVVTACKGPIEPGKSLQAARARVQSIQREARQDSRHYAEPFAAD